MITPERRLIAYTVNITVATVFFFMTLLMFYYRNLGPEKASSGFFWFSGVVGLLTAIVGGVEAAGRPPGERRFGITLHIEGVALFILTVIAWNYGAPVTLPPSLL